MKINKLFASDRHPVVVQPSFPDGNSLDILKLWLIEKKTDINNLIVQHGGILIRGFRITDVLSFRECVACLTPTVKNYAGGNTPRTHIGEGVYTSTEYPPGEEISLHSEMSFELKWAEKLFFCCLQPTSIGGQTTLASSRDVLLDMPSQILERLVSKRLKYIRTFSIAGLGKSWQSTYLTESRSEVEARIIQQGSTFSWLEQDILQVSTLCDAVQKHPVTGELLWFNQAEQWHPSSLSPTVRIALTESLGKVRLPHYCQFGDGEELDETELHKIRTILKENKLLFDWQKGDLLIIDNMKVMHGREPYFGDRKVIVSLA